VTQLGSGEIVQRAWRAGLVIPAFNVPYLPMIEPVIDAIRDQQSFAFIESARLEWIKFEAQGPAAVMEQYQRLSDPRHTRLHLDHVPIIDEDGQRVDCLAIIRRAIDVGFDSVMVDGSRLSLDENIAATAEVAALAHEAGVPCEAELGAILGHEKGLLPPYEELFASGRGFTDPREAHRFVQETDCDWLSVAIGNIHGAISGARRHQRKIETHLDLQHLARLQAAADRPLVLHGGSGVRREDVLASIGQGIAKVNVASEIRRAYEQALAEHASVAAAQQATYERTTWLIADYFGLRGSAARLLD
jgi:ketose-bisphosphate aldolase